MYKYFIRCIIATLFILFLVSCSVLKIYETSSVKTPVSQKPGNCVACHESGEVLPQEHGDTRDMTGNECDSCHGRSGLSLRTKIPLSHIHQLEGVSCKGCHEEPASVNAVDSKACQKCHSDEEALIGVVKELEINPHFSPHEGKFPDCNRCHHQHKSSENYCAKCHNLEYVVP